MTLGIALQTQTGLVASVIHLFNHAFIKGALFMAVACFMTRVKSTSIQNLAGLGKLMPWTSAAFFVGGLGLIGIPLTSGFVSKWYLVNAIIELGWWWLAVLVVITSLLAVIYVWRVVEFLYFREPKEELSDVKEAPLPLLAATWAMILSTIYFGIDTRFPSAMAQAAATTLLGQ